MCEDHARADWQRQRASRRARSTGSGGSYQFEPHQVRSLKFCKDRLTEKVIDVVGLCALLRV